jgi:hypothetical protein
MRWLYHNIVRVWTTQMRHHKMLNVSAVNIWMLYDQQRRHLRHTQILQHSAKHDLICQGLDCRLAGTVGLHGAH